MVSLAVIWAVTLLLVPQSSDLYSEPHNSVPYLRPGQQQWLLSEDRQSLWPRLGPGQRRAMSCRYCYYYKCLATVGARGSQEAMSLFLCMSLQLVRPECM